MSFGVRLKTGFFETKIYDLVVTGEELVFLPLELADAKISIPTEEITGITLKNEKAVEIEIQTRSTVCIGALCEKTDFEDLLKSLKTHVNTKIICEYEGGTDYA